jgi:hypothetical protein
LHDPNLSIDPVNDSPEVQDKKKRQYQTALDEYTKRTPKSAKPMVQTLGQLLQHLHGHGPGGATAPGAPGSQTPVGPSAQPGAAPGPPPGAIATPPFLSPKQSAAATASLPAAIPPPPQTAAAPSPAPTAAGPAIPPPPNAADMAATSRAGQTGFDLATKNTAEKNQLAAVLASHQQGELAEPAIIRQQLDEIAKLPQEQQLPAMMKMGMFPASMLRPVTKLVPNDPMHPEAGAHYESYSPLAAMMGGGEGPAAFTPSTFVPRVSNTTDPFGNVTSTTRGPANGGAPITGAGAGKAGASAGAGAGGARLGGVTGRGTVIPPPLDAEGHIPPTLGINENAREVANQLIDGTKDATKLTAKEMPGAVLARKSGWFQGKFTPKEENSLRVAKQFLTDALNNPALTALDAGSWDRMKMSSVINANPAKEGLPAQAVTTLASGNLTPQQAEFGRMYNQLLQVAAPIRQIVASGKGTEAMMERLNREMPNPATTQSSADARARLQRLLDEIDRGLQKGKFEELDSKGAATKANGRPPAVPGPPAAGTKKQFYRLNGKFYDAQTQQEIPSQGASQ